MQILEAEGRKFRVFKVINLERFRDERHANEYLHGMIYLRQINSNMIYIVDEIKDAIFEDLPSEPKVPVDEVLEPPTEEIQKPQSPPFSWRINVKP